MRFRWVLGGCLLSGLAAFAWAGPGAALRPVPIRQVEMDDAFWSPKIAVWRQVTLPDALGKFEKDGALANFDKVRDGVGGHHGGPPWYDGLIYEMIRAGSDFLASHSDPLLEACLDGIIGRIVAAAAKDPDGYLNTHTQLVEPEHRWGLRGGDDNFQHDLYNAGALVEAAVHCHQATGKTPLLEAAVRMANHMADVMGPPPKHNVVPGHSLPEEALVKLYVLFRDHPGLKARMPVPVDERRYLALARFWVDNRGNHEGRKSFGAYGQDHVPVASQHDIEGHAVRATLFGTGIAALAAEDGAEIYRQAAGRLWESMTGRKMYVTGGVGSVASHEGFGADYDLPNNGYLETCGSVGAGFFHHRMQLLAADARYADELERVLYNGVLCGVSLAGNTYYYENPLDAEKSHNRWSWHGCPCCPPMFLKMMAALPGLVLAQDDDDLYVNLYIGSRASVRLGGAAVALRQTTRYPWDGSVEIALEPERPARFALNLRIPAWCAGPRIRLNGELLPEAATTRGYARIEREWTAGDRVALELPMPVERIHAHPQVKANAGRVALQRGPLVYCLEGIDHAGTVRNLSIPPTADLTEKFQPDLLGGVVAIRGEALAAVREDWGGRLYRPAGESAKVPLMAIPYYAHNNRGASAMRVWIPEHPALAEPLGAPHLATDAAASASHCHASDAVAALNDRIEPAASDNASIPRMTWWNHRGTREWVQYDFAAEKTVSAVEVYWWDERRIGAHCRVPRSWRLFYLKDGAWQAVDAAEVPGTAMDRFNRLAFPPVGTKALRIEAELQDGWSGGILEWRVE